MTEHNDNNSDLGAFEEFSEALFLRLDDWVQKGVIECSGGLAVAVSGGADSMALGHLLWRWARRNAVGLLVLTVDHGLRAEAAEEARGVGAFFASLEGVTHKTLVWAHEEMPDARIQELARGARYDLMAGELRGQGITHLFTAHHQGDQAETFLFRLSKGSGLDGLAAMAQVQELPQGIKLCRPLLDVPKQNLLAYCAAFENPYFHDPSNDQEKYSRVRLRNSMQVLEQEGLSEKRLAQTARRMGRAREALDEIARQVHKTAQIENETGKIVFDFNKLKSWPNEIVLRVILICISDFGLAGKYGVRMERAENLVEDLLKPFPFRKRTLGKMIFDRDDKRGWLSIEAEGSAA